MRLFSYLVLCLLSFVSCRNGVRIVTVDDNELVRAEKEDLRVQFIYRQPVEGYNVTINWQPYGEDAETGVAVMEFLNKETGARFEYCNDDKYSNAAIGDIVFSKDFKGHKNGDIYHLDYDYEFGDGLNPLHHEAPFLFLDIDFDGEKELLINNWDLLQGGNTYDVFDIVKASNGYALKSKDELPFTAIQESSEIDFKNKTIRIATQDGYADQCSMLFSKKKGVGELHIPDSLQNTVGGRLVRSHNETAEFGIDSVYLNIQDQELVFPL